MSTLDKLTSVKVLRQQAPQPIECGAVTVGGEFRVHSHEEQGHADRMADLLDGMPAAAA